MRPMAMAGGSRYLLEFFGSDEEILATVDLSVSWCAGCKRNRITKIRYLLQHALNQRTLASARRRTDDKKNAASFGFSRRGGSIRTRLSLFCFTQRFGP